MPGLPSKSPFAALNQAEKLSKDIWNSSPPQVTSYITYPKTVFLDHPVTYTSPNCGLGWRFQITETHEQVVTPDDHVQDSAGEMDVTFQPHMCSSMPLSTVRINVKVSFPSEDAQPTQETELIDISLKSNQAIGSYSLPSRYRGEVHIEITLIFSDSDGLSFPTTSPPSAAAALQQSLDASSFVDSKFYLFSAKVRGRPTRPRSVYAKSTLLRDSNTYLRDLFSSRIGDKNSTPCDLREDVPEEIEKLDANTFDYEDDSDLEDDTEEFEEVTVSKVKTTNPKRRSSSIAMVNDNLNTQQYKSLDHFQDGRAFAINGTAHRTWKAFIYYTYTNEIHFNELKSQRGQASPHARSTHESNTVSCSPKSMYRFAKSANIPHLKSIAKSSISGSLSQQNIITELFSVFTSRYQEIIELEVDFLLKNFTEDVADKFDDVLQTIVSGGAPHCFRVLAFTLRRLRGASAEAAWGALRRYALKSTQATHIRASHLTSPVPAIQQGEKQIAPVPAEDRREREAEEKPKEQRVIAVRAEPVAAEAEGKEKESVETQREASAANGERGGSNSIFTFGGSDGGRGLRSWDEKAKPKAPSIKSLSSLSDDWNNIASTTSSFADDILNAPATKHTGDVDTTCDPPFVTSKAASRAPSKVQSRVTSRAPSPAPAPVPPIDPAIMPATGTATGTTAEAPPNVGAPPHADLTIAEKSTASGIPAVEVATGLGAPTEEPSNATIEDEWCMPVKVKKGKKNAGRNSEPATLNPDGANEASGVGGKKKKKTGTKAEEERLAREKAEQDAREKGERERAERQEEERKRNEKEETERVEEVETEKAGKGETEKAGKEEPAAAGGEGGGSNSIFNFGGTGWSSSGGSGGGWGLSSWGEKAKSKAPSIKNAIGGAWGGQTFGGFGFGSAGEDSQLSPEELKLINVGGEPARNSSSLFDDWNNFNSTTPNFAGDFLIAPVTEHTTHDPPPVTSKTTSQVPSKAQSRVASRAPPSASVPVPPVEPAIVSTTKNVIEATTEAPLNADTDPPADLISAENPTTAEDTTTPGTPAARGAATPGIPAAEDTMDPAIPAEEPSTATAEDKWSIPVKVKKGKKKIGGNSEPVTPNPDGANDAFGGDRKKKKKKGK